MIQALVINYNGGELILDCLRSLRKMDLPVLLIDNDSTDGSLERVEENFSDLKIIKNSKNIGFAQAVNQGVKRIDQPYILLINPDAELINSVDPVLNFMIAKKKVGLVGGLVLNPDHSRQPSCRGIPTLRNFPFGRTSTITKALPNNPLSRSMLLPELDYQEPQKVPAVCGAFMFIKKEIFDKIGGMDNNFFLYLEDIDICKRIWDYGGEVWFHPGSSCIHHFGEFHRDNYAKSRIHHLRSMIYFIEKHYHPNQILSSIFQVAAGLSAVYFLTWLMFKKEM